ncbi:hypothetical protein D3C77_504980 [compost metagenome]
MLFIAAQHRLDPGIAVGGERQQLLVQLLDPVGGQLLQGDLNRVGGQCFGRQRRLRDDHRRVFGQLPQGPVVKRLETLGARRELCVLQRCLSLDMLLDGLAPGTPLHDLQQVAAELPGVVAAEGEDAIDHVFQQQNACATGILGEPLIDRRLCFDHLQNPPQAPARGGRRQQVAEAVIELAQAPDEIQALRYLQALPQ